METIDFERCARHMQLVYDNVYALPIDEGLSHRAYEHVIEQLAASFTSIAIYVAEHGIDSASLNIWLDLNGITMVDDCYAIKKIASRAISIARESLIFYLTDEIIEIDVIQPIERLVDMLEKRRIQSTRVVYNHGTRAKEILDCH